MGSSGLIPRPPRRENNTPLPNSGLTKVFGGPHDFRITVSFPSYLRLHRVETVRVELAPVEPVDRVLDLQQQQPNSVLPVRLSIPGAAVSPGEAGLEISPFAASHAIFRVSPLVAGDLHDACLEVTRDGQTEALPLPMRSQGNGWLAWLAALTFLLPLLLHVPSECPAWANGGVERGLLAWLPRLPLQAGVASLGQQAFTWLATTGAGMHLSFFVMAALVMVSTFICVSRSPRPLNLRAPKFTLGSPPRPIDPPKYLTPVPQTEIAVTPPRQ